jgi:trehalose 6-phosphate synthase
VKSFPIGIDASDFQKVAARSRSNRIVTQTVAELSSRKLIIGVDRLDYAKGIPQWMEAYERFLLDNPDQRGRVTYLQVAPMKAAHPAQEPNRPPTILKRCPACFPEGNPRNA